MREVGTRKGRGGTHRERGVRGSGDREEVRRREKKKRETKRERERRSERGRGEGQGERGIMKG